MSKPAAPDIIHIFQGIGVIPDRKITHHYQIGIVLVGGPAHEAGLMVGDRIRKVDGIRLRGTPHLDIHRVGMELIRGDVGSWVTLEVVRPGPVYVGFRVQRVRIETVIKPTTLTETAIRTVWQAVQGSFELLGQKDQEFLSMAISLTAHKRLQHLLKP